MDSSPKVQFKNNNNLSLSIGLLVVAVGAEPVTLGYDHKGGPEAGGVVAGIAAVAQQDPFRVVAMTFKNIDDNSTLMKFFFWSQNATEQLSSFFQFMLDTPYYNGKPNLKLPLFQ